MKKGTVTVVMDGMAGSCGKGKVVGYIAKEDKPALAINNFMTNAGHTFVTDGGDAIMTQHLPTSMVNPTTRLCIGPGAAISPEILIDEIRKYSHIIGDRCIAIHPRAMIIRPEHAMKERALLKSGSTFKGCGTAQADKIMRVSGIELMVDYRTKLPADILERICICDTAKLANKVIDTGGDVIVEGSQGFDLDINYGLDYPHVTSRQCHAGQLIADCGISPRLITDIIMVIRPYPIRISNETNIGEDIYSGDYDGSREISWDIVKERCGAPDGVNFGELTTVTKKTRRVFEMNWSRLSYAVQINRPTAIALNFAQYIDWNVYQTVGEFESDSVQDFMERIEQVTNVPVLLVGTGAENQYMVDYGI